MSKLRLFMNFFICLLCYSGLHAQTETTNCDITTHLVVKHTYRIQWKLGWTYVFNPASASQAKVFWVYNPDTEFLKEVANDEKMQEQLHIVLEFKKGNHSGLWILDNEVLSGRFMDVYNRLVGIENEEFSLVDVFFASDNKRVGHYESESSAIINWSRAPDWQDAEVGQEALVGDLEKILCSIVEGLAV